MARASAKVNEDSRSNGSSGGAHALRAVLQSAADGDFADRTRRLLGALGYRSERTLSDQTGDAGDFVTEFPAPSEGTKAELAFVKHVQSVRILFQLTDDEIAAETSHDSFGFQAFSEDNAQSFIFVAAELTGTHYPRSRYVALTREVNKRLAPPAVVLFRTASGRLTLAFVQRSPNQQDTSRDILGAVSLIREIDPLQPHRAHLEILHDLSLDERLSWMSTRVKPRNFDGLLAAWLAVLDTEELNRRFYGDLFAWFQRGVAEARFPSSERTTHAPEEHVIRLITRLMFVWFIKEKGLVHEHLFVEERISPLLRGYDRETGDSYYRAVLQNLFFATLNTEVGKRGFSTRRNTTHRNFTRYRYLDQIADSDELLRLFAQTPFINGGLFDCLDTFSSTSAGGARIDCFSDNQSHAALLSIPNRLFFDDQGLLTLFDRYKFTVEENTPAEREVALDPELLGKVFENLLAAYNPETRDTARRQTGSYYTPRPVVDYMVDEALVATLTERVRPHDGDLTSWDTRLHSLFDYADAMNDAHALFAEEDKQALVHAVANLKVIDPAVGSGAFLMAILHKLTLALRRLDPGNGHWERLQKERAGRAAREAFDTRNQEQRDAELQEISETFEKYRDSDYGRKLYLIQHSIYGIDSQTIACQIAKLRFFISLAIEQQPDPSAGNSGIKPLPNLETRIVAADTLLAAGSGVLTSHRATDLQRELRANRERHFHATTRSAKLRCHHEDRRLRNRLASELRQAGMPADAAGRIAHWDPYDQNASAAWFDAAYMFGVTGGFDVVIGNPPYIQLQRNGGELRKRYRDAGYKTLAARGDLYQLFYERGCRLLRSQDGFLAYITSNSWLKAEYGKPLRRYFQGNHTPLRLLEMGKDVFQNTIVDTAVLLLREGASSGARPLAAIDMDRLSDKTFPPGAGEWSTAIPEGDAPWLILSPVERSVLRKMRAHGMPLSAWGVTIKYGVKTGYDPAFIIDTATRDGLVAEDPRSADIIKPILRGRDIRRYRASWARWWLIVAKYGSYRTIERDYPAIYRHLRRHKSRLMARGQCRYSRNAGAAADFPGQHHWLELDNNPQDGYLQLFAREKLFWMQMAPEGRFAYSRSETFSNAKAFVITGDSLKYLCAVLNSTIITWLVKQTAVTTGMGLVQWQKDTVERLPVPRLPAGERRPFDRIVDGILRAKEHHPSADTRGRERQIDRLVYSLYHLTEEEIAAVEGR